MSRTSAERHQITCPYCLVGSAILVVERRERDVQFNMREPLQCGSCRSYFNVKPELKIVGVKLRDLAPIVPISGRT